ncbi:flagellin [Lichenicola cladoniae]|uniref:Flagellin n=1 Tax=Lichenicola cladoniae TaxID=1484109 RepID=A0A6M8HJU2_9PROT|nr:flagellin [Lichenicola cladoniae]NPD69612.1 flagellin [Acetobacteraceae bacterium]QKE88736.1 flagellin [Lichenicola cladoniae]
MTLSINTNTAAMAALESLSATTAALNATESQVSTGKKVSSASDNPAIYAISQSMMGNISGLSAVSDSLAFGSQVVNTASKASADIIATLQTLQASVTTASTTGISLSTMQSQVSNALNQINDYARNSTFNGINLLTSASDAGSTVTNANLNVVTGLQGNVLTVANQATATTPNAVTLTDALGLTTGMSANGTVIANGTAAAGQTAQSILTGAATGLNISTSPDLAATDFAAGNNVVLTNGDGTTTTFEFGDGTTAAQSVETSGATANHVVVVLVDATTQSTSTMLGSLVSAMNNNGYNAVTQSNGSIDVTGQGVTASKSNLAAGGATSIDDGTALSASEAVITTIQSAITKMTGISGNLGATTQQITGMQSFTSDLSDALTSGVGALTDADLSATSARLTSLQTKQQLAIQSLSIANSQSSSILSLFR